MDTRIPKYKPRRGEIVREESTDTPKWSIVETGAELLPFAIQNTETGKLFNTYISREAAEKALENILAADTKFHKL